MLMLCAAILFAAVLVWQVRRRKKSGSDKFPKGFGFWLAVFFWYLFGALLSFNFFLWRDFLAG